jgi:hypothetical protein
MIPLWISPFLPRSTVQDPQLLTPLTPLTSLIPPLTPLTPRRDALTTLTSTRQSSILTAFLDALTRGGPNGLPRPIELHAHDPTRYVGDMLAWVHQTTASEHEFLQSLFGVGPGRRMVGQPRSAEEGLVKDALDKDLEGLSRPLKVRRRSGLELGSGLGQGGFGVEEAGRGQESGTQRWTQVDVRGRSVERGVETRKWKADDGG